MTSAVVAWAGEPNPPAWPASVRVFGPEDREADVQAAVDEVYATNGGRNEHGQFSPHRFALLFRPGSYAVDVPVGYYTHVAGLGSLPGDVVFTSSKGVYCEEANYLVSTGALDTFWRAAENFQTNADFSWNDNGHRGMLWAASQATSLRRIVVKNDLDLYQFRQGDRAAGYASGGYFGNSVVDGTVGSGSQQQFLARNSKVGKWVDGVWNMVTVGVEGANPSHCGADPKLCSHPYVNVEAAPEIAEKPFISLGTSGKYELNIPEVMTNRVGTDYVHLKAVGFESVYVASADRDTAATINVKLQTGLHVVLSPGVYGLDAPLQLNTAGQVLLGLGLATLVSTNGNAVVQVGNVHGARVAGILAEAGSQPTEALIEWGTGGFAGSAEDPGVLSDVYARVGGPAQPSPAQAKTMVVINSGHVIFDNSWLWRADHVEGGGLVRDGANPCEVAAMINGADVTAYGFKTEHALTDQVQWNGDRGKTFMFQAEMPYDVTQANFGDKGYVGYRVAEQVQEHAAFGVGVYHYFRDHEVHVKTAISAPKSLESKFVAPLAVFLNGKGVIQNVLNDRGNASAKDLERPMDAIPQWVCDAPAFLLSGSGSCRVGDPVTCPGSSAGCAGNACCPDGSTCPSAQEDFACCSAPKKVDCLKPGPPSPSPAPPAPQPGPPAPPMPRCKVGDPVACPGGGSVLCAGDQCCSDGSTCPSAHEAFRGCAREKVEDCTRSDAFAATEIFF